MTIQSAPARLDVRPLSAGIGAEIRGVDLRDELDDDTIADIRRVWLDRKVVFFPDQDLDPSSHLAFAARSAVSSRSGLAPCASSDRVFAKLIDVDGIDGPSARTELGGSGGAVVCVLLVGARPAGRLH